MARISVLAFVLALSPALVSAAPVELRAEPQAESTLTKWATEMSADEAEQYFARHAYCHVEMRQLPPKVRTLTVRELRRQGGPNPEVEAAPGSQGASPRETFPGLPLVAVSGSSEFVQLKIGKEVVDFKVSKRKRVRAEALLTLTSDTSDYTLSIQHSRPLLGCVDAPVKSCRMSTATLRLRRNADEQEGEPVEVRVRDLCGALRKETLFQAPVMPDGLSEWKVDAAKP